MKDAGNKVCEVPYLFSFSYFPYTNSAVRHYYTDPLSLLSKYLCLSFDYWSVSLSKKQTFSQINHLDFVLNNNPKL